MAYVDAKLEDSRFSCLWFNVEFVKILVSPKPILEFYKVHPDDPQLAATHGMLEKWLMVKGDALRMNDAGNSRGKRISRFVLASGIPRKSRIVSEICYVPTTEQIV